MSGFKIMWHNKDDDNPHFPGGKKSRFLNVARAMQGQFSLEPSTASNNVEGLRLQQIYKGHAALKYVAVCPGDKHLKK